jgi:hypothetical protein
VLQWLTDRKFEPRLTTADVAAINSKMYEMCKAEPYRMAHAVEKVWKWPSDMKLCTIYEQAWRQAKLKHDTLVREWVVETGVRWTPGLRTEVVFDAGEDGKLKGVVHLIRKELAAAIVHVENPIADKPPVMFEVNMEDVYA